MRIRYQLLRKVNSLLYDHARSMDTLFDFSVIYYTIIIVHNALGAYWRGEGKWRWVPWDKSKEKMKQ